jgi:hypothetical protein
VLVEPSRRAPRRLAPELVVLDAVYVLTTVAFLALMLLYVAACDRLGRADESQRGKPS